MVSLQKEEFSILTVHPQYINDASGNPSLVVLTAQGFEAIMEELEDSRLYDETKQEDTANACCFLITGTAEKRSMPSYTIVIAPKARKQLDKLSDPIAAPILEAIAGLADDPRPNGCKKRKVGTAVGSEPANAASSTKFSTLSW